MSQSCSSKANHLRSFSCCYTWAEVAAVPVVTPEVRVEGCRNRSQEEWCFLRARYSHQAVSAFQRASLCEAWKGRLETVQLPWTPLRRHPCFSSRFATDPRVPCTAVPCSSASLAAPSRSRSSRHNWTARGRHCGSRSGLGLLARSGGPGLHCSAESNCMSVQQVHLQIERAHVTVCGEHTCPSK